MGSQILVNGQRLVLNGITGNAGDRNAIATVIVPVEFLDLPSALQINAQDVANAIGLPNLICTSRPFEQLEYGGFEVKFQFEGFNYKVSADDAQNNCSYSFEPDEKAEPIQTHPNFVNLSLDYAWDSNKEEFPAQYTPPQNGQTALSKAQQSTTDNPLSGTVDWEKIGGIFTRTYAVTNVPADLYNNAGTIIDYPPDAEKLNIPRFKTRQWFKMAPMVQNGEKGSGSAFKITERYRLTGATNGAEAVIYAKGQLQD